MKPASDLCVWYAGGRPLLAYPAHASPVRRRAALRLVPAMTWKRKCLSYGIRALSAFGFRPFRGDAAAAGAPMDGIARVLAMIAERGRNARFDWAIAWPARPERRRLYVFFRFHCAGESGVVKLGFGEFNRRQFRNEAETLAVLSGAPRPFAVPAVLFEASVVDDVHALCLAGFPPALHPVSRRCAEASAAAMMRHLAGLPVPRRSIPLSAAAWFPSLEARVPRSDAAAGLIRRRDADMNVGWAHGDPGPGNMTRGRGGPVVLFDWENASPQAPVLTDAVALWIALRQRRILRAPRRSAGDMRTAFAPGTDDDLLVALAFLVAHENLAAGRLLENWA